MKNKKLSNIWSQCVAQDCTRTEGIGIAILRIGVGILFILAGVSKFMSIPMTVFMFAQVGLASFWVYIVASIEVLGGLMLLLGLWARLVAIPLGVVMLVATIIQLRFGGGIMGAIAPLVILLTQIQLYLTGSKVWALQNRISCKCGVCSSCTKMTGVKSTNKHNMDSVAKSQCVCTSGGDCICDENCTDCDCTK